MTELQVYIVSIVFFYWGVFHALPSSGDLQMAMDIEALFCPDHSIVSPASSSHDLPVKPPTYLHPACCLECSANITNCALDSNCCLGAFRELPSIDESISRVEAECYYPQLKSSEGRKQTNAPYPTKIIQRCHQDAFKKFDVDVIKRCETLHLDLIDIIPVTDPATLKTYRNKFCAQCHDVLEETFVYWSASVQCKYGDVQLGNRDDIINDVLKSDNCNMIFNVPNGYKNSISRCFKTISTCNETGYWKTYDLFIEQACLAYTKIYNFRYRNVFCYMCNTDDIEARSYCFWPPRSTTFYSFSVLINQNSNAHAESESSDTLSQCSHNQIFDHVKELCLNITCQFPKTVSNGTCDNMVDAIGGTIFDVYFELTPHDPHTAYLAIDEISAILPESFISEVEELGFIEKHVTAQTFAVATTGNLNMERVNKLSPILEKIVYYLEMTFAKTYPVLIIDSILAKQNTSIELLTKYFGAMNFTVNLSPWYRGSDVVVDIRTGNVLDTLNHSKVSDISTLPVRQFSIKEGATTYHLNKFSSCPLVMIDDVIAFTNATPDGKVHVFLYSVFLNSYDVYIQTLNSIVFWNDMESNNISIYICLETFKDIMRDTSFCNNGNCSEKDDVIVTVSFICIVLSLLSALCTFVVYCLFKELRTQPGINNMLLALYLFIAQALFQFGYGTSEYVSDVICTVIGVCTHFSWLTFVMWMNVCCIHTFRVFRPTRIHTRDNKIIRTTVLYTLYCWLIASLPVLVNIVLSTVESGGTNIGYGEMVCYISYGVSRVYLVTGPIVGIVVIDLALYVVVIVQIKRASGHFEHQRENRNLMTVYLKLSTITGGTWLLALIYVLTNATWAEYLFVIFNASLGVFIILAFIVNRRVYKLMTSLCRPTNASGVTSRKCKTTEITTGSSKRSSKFTEIGGEKKTEKYLHSNHL